MAYYVVVGLGLGALVTLGYAVLPMVLGLRVNSPACNVVTPHPLLVRLELICRRSAVLHMPQMQLVLPISAHGPRIWPMLW